MVLPGAAFFLGAGAPALTVATAYANGAKRRAAINRPVSLMRHLAFATGLGLFFLSTQRPFADWAHEYFSVHQVGILIARILAPFLIVSAHPAGLLIAGSPRPWRQRVLKPGLSSAWAGHVLRTISHPAVVVFLYVGLLAAWELPDMQAHAVDEAAVGLLMHASFLLVGLLFWTVVLERRPAPHAPAHGMRLMMIWLAMLGQIAVGALVTLKSHALYAAYASPDLADEQRGGFLIWIPSALILLVALLVVVNLWRRHEAWLDEKRTRWTPSNSAILLYPETGRALRQMAAGKNRRLAYGMAGFVLFIFSMACIVAAGSEFARDDLAGRAGMQSQS